MANCLGTYVNARAGQRAVRRGPGPTDQAFVAKADNRSLNPLATVSKEFRKLVMTDIVANREDSK